MYLHSNSIKKSFGGYSYFKSNQVLNSMLYEKKKKLLMEKSGYKFLDLNLSKFADYLHENFTRWDFSVFNHHKNLRDSLTRNDKLKKMVCIYGKCEEKFVLKNGFAFKYKKYIGVSGEFKYCYILTDSDKNIVYEFWVY